MRKHMIKNLVLPVLLALLTVLAQATPLASALEAGEPAATARPEEGTVDEPSEEGPAGSGPVGEESPSPSPAMTPDPAPDGEPATPVPEETQAPSPTPEAGDSQEDGSASIGQEQDKPQNLTAAVGALQTGTHEAYMTGYAGGYFKPENYMTRAEVCQVFFSLLKSKPENPTTSFTDVTTGWYVDAVAAMSALGAVNGYSDNTFRPNGYITRAEFIQVLSSFFPPEEPGEVHFTDVPESHWAYKAIAMASAKGWISGDGQGTFRPNERIKRCEAVTTINIALGRTTSDGFAADRETQEFKDVPKNHWPFLQIAEAADPTEEPSPTPPPSTTPTPSPGGQLPDGTKVGSIVRVNAETGLNIRSGAGTSFSVVTAVVNGTLLTVTDISKYPWIGVRTASGLSGYSHSDYLVLSHGNGNTSQNGTLSHSSLTLNQYMSARLDAKADANVTAMQWSSTNEAVARVAYTIDYNSREQTAVVYAGSPGTATLSFADGTGQVKDTCTVTVTAPQSVRFAYADGNSVPLGSTFDLVAVTDTSREEVRFDIVSGPAGGSFSSSSYEEESRQSTHGLPTNQVRVFRRPVKFGASGLYTLRAYSAQGGAYASDPYVFTVLVTQAGNVTTATNETRRTSGKMIDLIKGFEGNVWEIEDDRIVAGNPTVGHGYVVTKENNLFYNNLTATEAYAMLVNTVNNGNYSKAVENFRKENNIMMSQAQYDALVSFVYNCVSGCLNVNAYDTPNIILNMVTPPADVSPSRPYTGVLNVVKAEMYAQTDYTSTVVAEVPVGATVSITEVQVYRTSTKQEVWYKATYSGKTGWLPSGYVRLSGNFQRDLNYADSTSLANEFLQWNKSGGRLVPGLVYRRLAESKIFFFGNYAEAVNDGQSNYRRNTYGFNYPGPCKYLDQR